MKHPQPHESPFDPRRERLLELLAEQALFGLSDEEQIEVDQLLGEFPEMAADSMGQMVALLELGRLPLAVSTSQLPASLRRGIKEQLPGLEIRPAARSLPGQAGTPSVRFDRWLSWSGWFTAACLLVALLLNLKPEALLETAGVSPGERRTELMAAADDLIQQAWSRTEDAAAVAAEGDIIWSNQRQEGYMRIRGLAANDPQQNQYQLWIFDGSQKHPVDGGVFDIPAGVDEVIVPIDAKLQVRSPTMFAITVEPPGGVVVSDRERIPLLAEVAG